MKVLKGFLVSILSLLLFLSLFIFGTAFMLKSTLLNPDFIISEVDKIDISSLVHEITEEQIGDQVPEDMLFIKEAVYEVITDQEPWLKEQLNTAIYTGYDYLLGESDRLEIVISLETPKENLRDSLWQTFREQLPIWLPALIEDELKPYLKEHIHELADQIPKEYLPPELVGLPEEQLKLYLDQYLEEIADRITHEAYMPEISGLLEALVKPYFDQYYDDFVGQIPSELAVDESSIPPEVMEQIALARQYIGYFQTYYYALIGFMVLLVLGIILINRNVRHTTRALGTNLFIYGAMEYAAVYIARNFIPKSLPFDIPSSLQTWLLGLPYDILAPLQSFSLGVLICGVVLIIVSIVYKPHPAED